MYNVAIRCMACDCTQQYYADKFVSGLATPPLFAIIPHLFIKMATGMFRNWISADGSTGFKAETGRYHLYVSYACPYAHRTLVTRALKGLEDVISIDVVDIIKVTEKGWNFSSDFPDSINGASYLSEIYFKVCPDYSDRFTVPVLFDKQKGTIVSNESAEIIRMLNSEFNEFSTNKDLDLYPAELKQKIDELNEWINL